MTPDPETTETSVPEAPTGSAKPHSWLRIWGEVAGAWALALAHPIYANIASGPEALTSYGVRRPDLLVLIVVVSLLGPLLISLAELVIRRLFGDRPRQVVHALVLGGLLALVVWQWLLNNGSPGFVRNLLPVVVALLIAWLYVKTELVRNFAQILSFATVVVIVAFCLDYPINEEILPHKSAPDTPQITADTPVVMVIFDEFPLAALERPDGTIDPRFPAFAELARKANWYPDTSPVADQTAEAVPSILTGDEPYSKGGLEPPSPGLANYPNSICQIASDGGYEVHAYEPVTDLCKRSWDLGTRITATIRRAVGADDPGAGISLTPGGIDKKVARKLGAPFRLPWTEVGVGRREAFDEFTDGLPDNDRSLSVLHVTLPHVLWMYLPDGKTYPGSALPDISLPASRAETNRDAQQMLLQLQFTDRELGKLIQRMKEQGAWDKSLFIVTADHGAGFQAGQARRMINLVNVGWIGSIPLFIKFPGQKHGRVVKGTVTSRDIAPTVLGQLGVTPDDDVQGRDLAGATRLPHRKSVEIASTIGGTQTFDEDHIQTLRAQASRQFAHTFGQSFYAAGGHASLLGRRPTGLRQITATPSDPTALEDVDTSSDEIPAYFQASLSVPYPQKPGPLAIALNGRIVATARAWPYWGTWEVGSMLPARGFRDGTNTVQVFEIRSGE